MLPTAKKDAPMVVPQNRCSAADCFKEVTTFFSMASGGTASANGREAPF